MSLAGLQDTRPLFKILLYSCTLAIKIPKK